MPKTPPNLMYGVADDPPLLASILQGFQHIFVISISLIFPVVIVRSMGGTAQEAEFMVSMAMLAAGIGTMLQALNRKGVGSGYLCPSLCGPSYLSASMLAANTGGLHLLFGMTSVAGVFETLISRVMHRLRALFPPEVTGLVVAMVGITVIPVAITNFMGRDATDTITEAPELLVALITLGTMVGINVWSKGKLRLYSVLVGMFLGYGSAFALGLLDSSHLDLFREAPIIAIPTLDYFGWSFDAALLLPFLIAVTASSLKSVGDLTTCQKINDLEWKRTDMENVSKGILSDGLSAFISGVVGSMGQSTSSSNVGLSIGTGVTCRKIAFFIGGILFILAFLPKLSTIFVIMPKPVMGATLIYAVSFMIVAGFQIIMTRMLDARRTFLVGIPMIFGISVDVMPELYENVPHFLQSIFSSSLALAAVLVVLINLVLRVGVSKRQQLVLLPGRDSAETIFNFMETQGSSWGARKEVIYRAISAMNEFFESASALKLAKGEIETDVSFDEFNLDVDIRYEGKPLVFHVTRPTEADLLRDEESVVKLSGFMIRQYVDAIKSDSKDGYCRIKFHFDH